MRRRKDLYRKSRNWTIREEIHPPQRFEDGTLAPFFQIGSRIVIYDGTTNKEAIVVGLRSLQIIDKFKERRVT